MLTIQIKNSIGDLHLLNKNGFTEGRFEKITEYALWILILALAIRITLFIRQRTGNEFANIDTYAIVEIFIVFLTFFFIFTIQKLPSNLNKISTTSLGMFLAFYVLGMISSLWSPLPAYSFFRAFEVLSQILAVSLALSYCNIFFDAERKVLAVSILIILMSIGSYLILGGFSSSWSYWHSNGYPASAAMICCYCIGEMFTATGKRALMLRIFAVLSFGFIVLGTSSASIIALLCGLVIVSIFLPYRSAIFIGALCLLLLLLCSIGSGLIFKTLFPGKTIEEIQTISGRMSLWESYIQDFWKSPIYGHGFAVSARLSDFRYTTNTHNAIFSIALGTGFIGLVICLYCIMLFIKESFATIKMKRPGAVGSIGAITAGWVASQALAFLGESWTSTTLVFVGFLCLHVIHIWEPVKKHLLHHPKNITRFW